MNDSKPTTTAAVASTTTTTTPTSATRFDSMSQPAAAGLQWPWALGPLLPKLDTAKDVFAATCATAVIFGGAVPYVPQYLKIKRTQDSSGFSTYVCLTLLVANILRIIFWFGRRFETPLLLQSFVMIGVMLAMVEVCVRVREPAPGPRGLSSVSTIGAAALAGPHGGAGSAGHSRRAAGSWGLSMRHFWDWPDFGSYVKFLLGLAASAGLATYLLINSALYVETLGFVALLAESMLGLPQLLRNHSKRSTRGMSVEMVAMWLSGDLFKTAYYLARASPLQFLVCGALQVLMDVAILAQVLLYRRPDVLYRKLPKCT